MSPTFTASDLAELQETLRRCSPQTIDAAIHYRKTGDSGSIPQIVLGLLDRYQPATATVKLSEANENSRLIEDIGLDSLTLLEIVLSIEEVLQVRIENEELREIRTLGLLNQFLQSKIAGTGTETPAPSYTREQIMLVLPQQHPFLFLDGAELKGETVKAHYMVKGNEFFLEGHFKDEPIFPASIVFEALGQAACLWVLEKAPALLGKEIKSNQVFFASLDGAHFLRKTDPGEKLEFEQKLVKLRDPLAIFEGVVTSNGQCVARIEKLVLAFGESLTPAEPVVPAANGSSVSEPVPVPGASPNVRS